MILASGCFDGLHAGHVRYLQAAKNLDPSQRLVVSIAPDSYIQRQKQRNPYWSQIDRAITVIALTCVDGVYMQAEDSIAETIRRQHPSIVVKGRDWRDSGLPADVVGAIQDVGAAVVFTETDGRHVRQAHA